MIQPAECINMRFNPFEVPKGKYIQKFYEGISRKHRMYTPPIDDMYANWTDEDISNMVSFMLLILDHRGPLRDERDLDYRNELAAEALGLTEKNKVMKEVARRGSFFIQVMMEIFKYLNDHKYTEWFAVRTNYNNQVAYVTSPITSADDPKKKNEATFALGELRSLLYTLEASLFPSAELQALVNEKAMEEDLGSYAEEFAEDGVWTMEERIGDENSLVDDEEW